MLSGGVGGDDGTAFRGDAAPADWHVVSYQGVRFAVPGDWPIESPDAYEYQCWTHNRPGVYLAPRDLSGAARCPAAREYAATLHIQVRHDNPWIHNPDDPSKPINENGMSARLIGHDPNGWYEVHIPALGVQLIFYGTPAQTRSTVLRTIGRA